VCPRWTGSLVLCGEGAVACEVGVHVSVVESASRLAFVVAPAAVLVGLVIVLCVRRRNAWARACLFGGGYFLVALLPVLGFFDVFYFRYSFVADHFQYLAGVGLITLVASAATNTFEEAGRQASVLEQ